MSHCRGSYVALRLVLAGLVVVLGLGGAARPAVGAAVQPLPSRLPQAPGGAPLPANCASDVVGGQISGGAIPDPGTVTFTVNVANPLAYTYQPSLATNVSHAQPEHLDMKLVSPSGTEVTLSTDNANLLTNFLIGFVDNTREPVTDAGPSTSLYVPEEAMGAFRGEPMGGGWRLVVTDDTAGVAGSLGDILFLIEGLTQVPVTHTVVFTNTTPQNILDNTTLTSTLQVTTPGTTLLDLKLQTFITHTYTSDLQIYLRAPNGLTTTISTVNGGGTDNVFNGTLWDDHAGAVNPPGPVTDHVMQNLVLESPLVPEGAMSRFNGLNPNGQWSLIIHDLAGDDTGRLDQWSLIVTTGACEVDEVYLPFIRR